MNAERKWGRALLAPLVVFAVALVTRAVAAASIRFPIPEDSAYYVAAARNLATGRGLVVDALWSYATPPLTLPHPAFDLWQPLASLVAAPFMAILGPSLASAQVSSVLFGALAAPLGWAIGRDASIELGLSAPRVASTALAAGLLIAVTPLLVLQGAEPDSSAPFTLLALAACWLIPRALAERSPGARWRVLLGLALGLAYLARQEALYLVAAYLLLAWIRDRREGLAYAVVPIGAAALVVAPWLVRQAVTWDRSPLVQLFENAWSVRSQDIFAWSHRPTLADQLALGIPGMIGLRAEAVLSNAATLLVAAFPAGPIGLAALALRLRVAAGQALSGLAIYALLTFVVVSLIFPVAGRAGLFHHAAGPIVILLAVAAAIGVESTAHRLAELRRWRTPGLSLAGLSLAILALPLLMQSIALDAARSSRLDERYRGLAAASPGDFRSAPVISDHPIWLSVALGVPSLALPAEDPFAVLDLAGRFEAHWVIVNADSDWPPDDGWSACFHEVPVAAGFRLFRIVCLAASP